MSETISPYALTTLQRVKDRLFDTNISAQPTSFDTLLTRMINSFSEWFERETGGRELVSRLRSNEIYSMSSPRTKRIVTRQAPIFFLTTTGNTQSGSSSITGVANTTGAVVGMPIMADNIIPVGGTPTTITSISGSTIGISRPANTTVTGQVLQINGLVSFQFRAGPPSAPSWTAFIPDQYEVVNDGKAGVIRIYGSLPSIYSNMARLTYYAGYQVNWANAGDNVTHTLPAAISECVENVVVRRFKRRQLAGKTSEGLEGATTSWGKEIEAEDQDVIDQFRRMPTIF